MARVVKQETVKVTKEVTFDCAHILSGHEALCKNLHGHTYKLQVTVEGRLIHGGSSGMMVMDFKHLKEAIQQVVMMRFDHALIVSDFDHRGPAEEALLQWAEQFKMRHLIITGRTTAENMARYFKKAIYSYLVDELGLNTVTEVSIRLYETPTSFAEV